MKNKLLLISIAIFLTSMSYAQFFEDVSGNSRQLNADQTGWDKYAFSGGILWCSSTAGDLDNDGYPDLIYFGNNTQGASGTWIDLNNGDGTFRRAFTSFEGEVVGGKTIPVIFPGLYNGGLDIADFDNDGDMDVVLQGDANPGGDGFSKDYATAVDFYAKVLRNDGKDANGTLIFTSIPLPYAGVRGSIYFGKVNNDNLLEIIQSGVLKIAEGQFVKTTILYKWNVTSSIWEILPLTGDALAAFGEGYARFGDYNKDGLDDILISGWAVETALGEGVDAGVTKLYKNIDGNGKFEEDKDIILAPQADAFANFVDYDNDGDLDIALCGFNFESGNREIKIYKNSEGIYEDINAEFLATVQGGPMLFVDVNGDGYLDILTWGWNNAHLFFLFLNNGDNQTYSFPEIENFVKKGDQFGTITPSWKAGATLLDFDKDGRKDVFYVNFVGELLKNLTGAIVNTAIPETNKKENASLYYSNNKIFTDEKTDGIIEIFSIDGRSLLYKKISAGKSTLNVSLRPGLYVAKITSKGQTSTSRKFIVK